MRILGLKDAEKRRGEMRSNKIKKGLDRFKVKRDAVEKYSDANYADVAAMLKKTLDLLSLQLKEFKIKSLLNQVLEVYQK